MFINRRTSADFRKRNVVTNVIIYKHAVDPQLPLSGAKRCDALISRFVIDRHGVRAVSVSAHSYSLITIV